MLRFFRQHRSTTWTFEHALTNNVRPAPIQKKKGKKSGKPKSVKKRKKKRSGKVSSCCALAAFGANCGLQIQLWRRQPCVAYPFSQSRSSLPCRRRRPRSPRKSPKRSPRKSPRCVLTWSTCPEPAGNHVGRCSPALEPSVKCWPGAVRDPTGQSLTPRIISHTFRHPMPRRRRRK